jgi:tetratricopeptide (TPR) repeat protein
MPPYASSDIVHNASTDHRIPRRAGTPDAPPVADAPGSPSGMQTLAILFHHDKLDAQDPEYRRDLGLAVAAMSEREDAPEGAARQADALLDEAVKKFPDDVRAWEAKGRRALLEGRAADALAACEACLAQAPDREAALNGAAEAARLLGKPDAALDYWRRSVAVDPWSPVARRGLAESLASRENWEEAQAQCREWLRLAPENVDGRKLLIRCLLKGGDRAGAEAELTTLKALRPGSDADLDFWFSRQR